VRGPSSPRGSVFGLVVSRAGSQLFSDNLPRVYLRGTCRRVIERKVNSARGSLFCLASCSNASSRSGDVNRVAKSRQAQFVTSLRVPLQGCITRVPLLRPIIPREFTNCILPIGPRTDQSRVDRFRTTERARSSPLDAGRKRGALGVRTRALSPTRSARDSGS